MDTSKLINTVFSQSTLNDLVTNENSLKIDDAYKKYIGYSLNNVSLNSKISALYQYLQNEHRNEYYFKNTLFNKLLLGVHSLNTTYAMTETPINQSIADFILINGKAIVYEIKTELDTLNKLDKQIDDYFKVFDHVVILSVEKYKNVLLEKYKDTPVGISILTKRNTISVLKKPEKQNYHLEYIHIYKFLRKHERRNILLEYYGNIPDASQFKEFETYLKLFKKIPIEVLYSIVIKVLKDRNNNFNNKFTFKNIPYELKGLIYFSNLSIKNKHKLLTILEAK